MTILPATLPANFNLAVERLKRTLRQDKVVAAVLSQAQVPPEQPGLDVDVSPAGSNSSLGGHVNTDV
jgi:hypothetical protein